MIKNIDIKTFKIKSFNNNIIIFKTRFKLIKYKALLILKLIKNFSLER